MVSETEYAAATEYKKFWDDLGNSITKRGEYTRVTKSGSKIHIKGSYSIITDQDGKVSKILKCVTDVTNSKHQAEKLAKLEADMQKREQDYLRRINREESHLVSNGLVHH